ncbi:DUF1330 domain-containing protein [Rhodopseudomonas palustris]|nr:DUF1330 domain-containing protein [Rhodopseudomonas palustris]
MGIEHLNIEGLKELEREDRGPVVMVNLMRFNEGGGDGDASGWDAYLRYSTLTVPMIKARGGTLLWTGTAKAIALGRDDGRHWDYLALVYYPSIEAFLDMMNSAEYELECDPHRRAACADHLIICTRESYSKFGISSPRQDTLSE